MTSDIRTTEVDGGLTRIDNAWACERCGRVFVGDYLSANHCNATGRDIVLCLHCCATAEEERAAVERERDSEMDRRCARLGDAHMRRLAELRSYGCGSDLDARAAMDADLMGAGLVAIRDGRVSEPLYVTEPVGCWHPRRPML